MAIKVNTRSFILSLSLVHFGLELWYKLVAKAHMHIQYVCHEWHELKIYRPRLFQLAKYVWCRCAHAVRIYAEVCACLCSQRLNFKSFSLIWWHFSYYYEIRVLSKCGTGVFDWFSNVVQMTIFLNLRMEHSSLLLNTCNSFIKNWTSKSVDPRKSPFTSE